MATASASDTLGFALLMFKKIIKSFTESTFSKQQQESIILGSHPIGAAAGRNLMSKLPFKWV